MWVTTTASRAGGRGGREWEGLWPDRLLSSTTCVPTTRVPAAVIAEPAGIDTDAAAAADSYQRPPPRVMICNRGEIARRVIRTANQHGLETVAIYTHVSLGGRGKREVLPAVTHRSAIHPSCICVLVEALYLNNAVPVGPSPGPARTSTG